VIIDMAGWEAWGGEELGRRAREKCVREHSWDAIERVLADVLRPFA
jgi:hypothetical protein